MSSEVHLKVDFNPRVTEGMLYAISWSFLARPNYVDFTNPFYAASRSLNNGLHLRRPYRLSERIDRGFAQRGSHSACVRVEEIWNC